MEVFLSLARRFNYLLALSLAKTLFSLRKTIVEIVTGGGEYIEGLKLAIQDPTNYDYGWLLDYVFAVLCRHESEKHVCCGNAAAAPGWLVEKRNLGTSVDLHEKQHQLKLNL